MTDLALHDEGVFTPVVCLLWSESADELFSVSWFLFTWRKSQVNQVFHYTPCCGNLPYNWLQRENVQFAHWPDVFGGGAQKQRCGLLENFHSFHSYLLACTDLCTSIVPCHVPEYKAYM